MAKMTNKNLRNQWLGRYLVVQGKTDGQIRKVLAQAAEDAYSEINRLSSSTKFSDGVRTAQLRMVMQIIKEILNDGFKKYPNIIKLGLSDSSGAAVTAFGETDIGYLRRAFKASGISEDDFISGQRREAEQNIMHVVNKLYGFDKPLSTRIYRTRSLATTYVRNEVTRKIAIGASPAEIAKSVRGSFRANVPGGVGYASLRLARTELNNAFHATSIELAKDRPWVTGMDWNLSSVHKMHDGKQEICELYSHKVYTPENVPPKPHPQCRCYATPNVLPMSEFLDHLTNGSYDDWIRNAA